MRLFTVHLPVTAGTGAPAFERAEFVGDGFHVLAFLLTVIWCLWKRLWIPALVILVLSAALFAIGRALHMSGGAQLALQIVLALLVGLEASNLRRFGLRRRGYVDAGGVAADNLDSAEAIFFARMADEMEVPGRPRPWQSSGGMPAGPARAGEDVVGLFPEYRGR